MDDGNACGLSQTERGTRTVGVDGIIATLPNDVTVYAIDDGKYLWVVSRRITKKNQKPLDVTVNAPVKFAIQTNDCYLIDDEGKEHKLVVEKKTLKAN